MAHAQEQNPPRRSGGFFYAHSAGLFLTHVCRYGNFEYPLAEKRSKIGAQKLAV
jgi:hypothetical protein